MQMARDKDFVDVRLELIHWRAEFQTGILPAMNYAHEVEPIIKVACDIYIIYPHGSRAEWIEYLKIRLERNPTLRGNNGSTEIAALCWDKLIL